MAEGVQSFTSRKLDWIAALLVDPEVSDAEFRFGVRLIEALNEEHGYAYLSDPTICDDLSISRDKVWRSRKRLETLGYIEVDRGHGQRGSYYRFLGRRVHVMLDLRTEKRDARKDARELRKIAARARNLPAPNVRPVGRIESAKRPKDQTQRTPSVRKPRQQMSDASDAVMSDASDTYTLERYTVEETPSNLSGLSSEDVSGRSESPAQPLPAKPEPSPSDWEGEIAALSGNARAVAKPAEPIILQSTPDDARLELARLLGDGSLTKGADVMRAMGRGFTAWADRLGTRGLTASDVEAVRREARA